MTQTQAFPLNTALLRRLALIATPRLLLVCDARGVEIHRFAVTDFLRLAFVQSLAMCVHTVILS